MKIALVVGHTEKSPGAKNEKYELTEYTYCTQMVDAVIDGKERAG